MNTLEVSEGTFKSLFAGLRSFILSDDLQKSQAFVHLIEVAEKTLSRIEEATKKFHKEIIENITKVIPEQITQAISTEQIDFCEKDVYQKLKQLKESNSGTIQLELQSSLKQLSEANFQIQKYLKNIAESLERENTNLSKTFENSLQRSSNIISVEVIQQSLTSLIIIYRSTR